MTTLPNDKVEFEVVYTDDKGFTRIESFKTFAAAAGYASGLNGMIRFLNATFSNGTSLWSGTMYVIGRDNTRQVANEYFCRRAIEFIKRKVA